MKILVTGAAGLLGGELCKLLVAGGHSVTALVHTNREIRANDGTLVPVAGAVAGDVSLPRLGWEVAQFEAVAAAHELLIHCAATVRFDLEEADYQSVNVEGTRNALALAEAGGMDYLHIGTAYVCGTRDGLVREDDPLPESGFANGYEASKAAGERLVRASELRWAVARPAIVLGDSASGAIRQFDTTYTAFKLIAEGRVRAMPATPGATLDFVPIDHVAQGVVDIAMRMEQAAGGTFHLVSGQPLAVARFAAAIGSYKHFHQPALVAPESFDPAALAPLERRLFRRIAGLYASYFQRDPRFDDANFQVLTGRACPPTGETYLRRLIDHCIAVGFLPMDQVSGSR